MKGGVWLCGLRVIQRCLTWKIWYLTLLISMHVFSPQGLFARSVLNLESWKKREIAGMLLTLWIAQREHTASLELLYKNGFVLKYITLSSESIFFRGHYINNTLSDVSFLFCHFMTGSIGYCQCNMICGGWKWTSFQGPRGEAGKKKTLWISRKKCTALISHLNNISTQHVTCLLSAVWVSLFILKVSLRANV